MWTFDPMLAQWLFFFVLFVCMAAWLHPRHNRKIDTRGYGLLFTYDQPRDNWRRMKNYRKRRTAAYLLSWNRMREAYKTRNGAKKFRGSWYDRTIDTVWVEVPGRFYKGRDFIQQLRNR